MVRRVSGAGARALGVALVASVLVCVPQMVLPASADSESVPTNVVAHRVVDDPTALRVEFTPVEGDVLSYRAICKPWYPLLTGIEGTASARPGDRLKVVGLSPGTPYACTVRAVLASGQGPHSVQSSTVWTGGQYAIDVSGVVRDRFGEPLAGATVVLRSINGPSRGAPEPDCTVKTDSEGRYTMRNRKCVGWHGSLAHTVTVSKKGYGGIATISPDSETFSNQASVTRWKPSTADFTLAKVKAGTWRGGVRDPRGPVNGARVWTSNGYGGSSETVTADRGTYKIGYSSTIGVQHGSRRLSLTVTSGHQTFHWVGVVNFHFD